MSAAIVACLAAVVAVTVPASGGSGFPGRNGAIVFVKTDDNTLYEVAASTLMGVPILPGRSLVRFPQWSPTGRRIVHTTNEGVFITPPGGPARRLNRTLLFNLTGASWSPMQPLSWSPPD